MTLSRPHLRSLLPALALALATAGAARAQEAAPPPADSAVALAAEGRGDGRLHAGRPGTGGSFAAGFAAGLPIGFFGLAAGVSLRPVPVAGALGGVAGGGAALGFAERPARVLPPELEQRLAGRGSVYGEAFRHAYSARLRDRRRKAVMAGGLTGTAVGLVLVLQALSGDFM